MISISAQERFFQMVSAKLRKKLTFTDYWLGKPIPKDYGPNTEIEIKPTVESHLYFNRILRYNRGELDDIFKISVHRGIATDLYGLLDQINDEPIFQINIRKTIDRDYTAVLGIVTIDDVYNVELPSFGDRKFIDIPMRAKPESLFLTGTMLIRVMKN